MTVNDLLLEIGSEAFADLTTDEINAIVAKYSSTQVKLGGMKAFELLMKKFKSNYRMGRMYEHLSQKFEAYRKTFYWYTQHVSAGTLAHDSDLGEARNIQREKFLKDTHSTQDVIDASD